MHQEFLSDVVAQAKVRCITIRRGTGEDVSLVSGVVIDSTHILTARHCVEGRGKQHLEVIWQNQRFSAQRVVSKVLSDMDVALLEVPNHSFPVPRLAPHASVDTGIVVFGFNTAFRERIVPYSGVISETVATKPTSYLLRVILRWLTGFDRGEWWPCHSFYLLVKSRVPFVQSMSGSALYDGEGRLVGILVGRTLYNFFKNGKVIPVDHFKSVFTQ
ncbi:serine protease [Patescibacteria group bacterium AH-259-L07]|nr:serine protease [Patescibacteria group bacterium AH-259-L07]